LNAGRQSDDALTCSGRGNLGDVDRQGCRGVPARVSDGVVEDVLDAVWGIGIADVIEVALRIYLEDAVLARRLEVSV